MFITFEGGEGVGKTTQIQMLSQYLSAQGIDHVMTGEPGGTEGGKLLRRLILDSSMPDWDPMTEYMLLLADRKHHIETTIKPALESKKWIICDRYQDCSTVYQGYVKGLNREDMNEIYSLVVGGLRPHRTFILDMPVGKSYDRVSKRGEPADRMESEGRAFHERVRQGYLDIASHFPERCVVIDADRDPQVVHDDIVSQL